MKTKTMKIKDKALEYGFDVNNLSYSSSDFPEDIRVYYDAKIDTVFAEYNGKGLNLKKSYTYNQIQELVANNDSDVISVLLNDFNDFLRQNNVDVNED